MFHSIPAFQVRYCTGYVEVNTGEFGPYLSYALPN